MPLPPYDGTVWDNTDAYNTQVAQSGVDTNFYKHGTFVSNFNGGVTIGYGYHLPPNWYTEPNRKFPVVYTIGLGGGSDENSWYYWTNSGPNPADPLADSPQYTSAQAGPPNGVINLNWGVNANCVTILANGTLASSFMDAASDADMFNVMMMESESHELINEIERANHPVLGGRLVPQGFNDPNGGKYRGIQGHSGGSLQTIAFPCYHPSLWSSSCSLAQIGTGFNVANPQVVHIANSNSSYWVPRQPVILSGEGQLFTDNLSAIQSAGIAYLEKTSFNEGGSGNNTTVTTNFVNQLQSQGFDATLEVLSFDWHTAWAHHTQPLPWHVSKFKLNPTCNGPTGLTASENTQLVLTSQQITVDDVDPQLLTLTVTAVSNPVNCTVSVDGSGNVTFTPAANFVGTASFNYTAQNSDVIPFTSNHWSGSAIANVQVQTSGAIQTTTTLGASINPSLFGQSVTFTATVIPNSGGPPTGTVTFFDGVIALGTITLSSGVATLATPALSVATHGLTASYSGDANFSPSTSSSLSHVVNVTPTTTFRMTEDNALNFHQISSPPIADAGDITYLVSGYLKSTNRGGFLQITNERADGCNVEFNLQTGQIDQFFTFGNGILATNVSITDASSVWGTGWFYVTATMTSPTASSAGLQFSIGLLSAAQVASYQGDGSSFLEAKGYYATLNGTSIYG